MPARPELRLRFQGFNVESFFQKLGAKQSARLPVFPRKRIRLISPSSRVTGVRTFYVRNTGKNLHPKCAKGIAVIL